eukprot:TRINITY_DN12149_c0_g1_i5.p1 TRINITY_DN12149_c0_g1~~TRINITY_DN12149_c0_g1_i5.p1  ORF type:complete len:435 (-),score=127.23 TRINITY_DN12149_c0_g1_i5:77-1315(-)
MDGAVWACPQCTLENSLATSQCQVCGFVNPELQGQQNEEGWTCEVCTFSGNSEDVDECEACGTPDEERVRVRRRGMRERQAAERRRREEEERRRQEEEAQKKAEADRKAEEIKQKRAAEEKEAEGMVPALEVVNLCLKQQQGTSEEIGQILDQLYRESAMPFLNQPPPQVAPLSECSVCYSEFDEQETLPVRATFCGHQVICRGCFQNYISIRIRDKEVMPFIRCPEPECRIPLAVADLRSAGLDLPVLYSLAQTSLLKLLARQEKFANCKTSKCPGGFWVTWENKRRMTCTVCETAQDVEQKKEELDDEFKKMIREGKLRPCPKCQHMTMKEYGICNVIECGKCGIWWNWRTRETGRDSRALKDRARMSGSLWEPGELAYQQRLEYQNPEEFRALLERNGVRYDPNYVRGT